jgi:cell division septum initiation protein DivIVA
MPTDLDPAFARKRAAQAKLQTEINKALALAKQEQWNKPAMASHTPSDRAAQAAADIMAAGTGTK